MIMANTSMSSLGKNLKNGAGAAAFLAAGVGCAALGAFTLLADASSGMKKFLNFYNPTGPLSGVTALTIVVWLAAWVVLAKKWDGRDVGMTRVSVVAIALLAAGFALTIPPLMELLQGK